MATYDADTIPACLDCDRFSATKTCRKCAVAYCKHFASITDVRFCANCMGDFTIKESIMVKTIEKERADGTVIFSRKSQARHITLQGNDWLFSAHLIEEMNDQEIEATIEYHRANVSLMLQERESRKLERYKKLAGIKFVNVKHESQEEREKRESKSKKKTKVKEIEMTPELMAEMITKLFKNGLTQEQLIKALGAK